jgi:hypothetical protein
MLLWKKCGCTDKLRLDRGHAILKYKELDEA